MGAVRRFDTAALLRLGAIAGLVAASVSSCAPLYFPELNAAAGLISHMSAVGAVGPLYVQGGGAGGVTATFLPARPTGASTIQEVLVTSGFVVSSSASQDYVTFAYLGAQGQVSTVGGFDLPVSGADPHYPLYEYETITSPASTPSMIVFRYDPVSIAASAYELLQGDVSSGQFTAPYGTTLALTNGIFSGYTPIGGSIDPVAPSPLESFSFAVTDGTGTVVGTAGDTVNGSTGIFPPAFPPAAVATPLPGTLLRTLLFSNVKGGTSVAQYWSGGAWVTVQWAGASSRTMTGVTRRLDAVLSNGDLLSAGGGMLTLYDSTDTGTVLLSTPLQGLQFCYEAWVGTTPYVFFSLPVSGRHGNVTFNVFAIATADLQTLGQ